MNKAGGYSCGECAPGYVPSSATKCTDEDECVTKTDACGADELCVNEVGSYHCEDIVCAPNATFCDGETVRTCNATGTSSTYQWDCPATTNYCEAETKTCLPYQATDGSWGSDRNFSPRGTLRGNALVMTSGRRITSVAFGSGADATMNVSFFVYRQNGTEFQRESGPYAGACNGTSCSASFTFDLLPGETYWLAAWSAAYLETTQTNYTYPTAA
jgi:hypothetical protein